MYFVKSLVVLAAAAAAATMVSATPGMKRAVAVPDDNCNKRIGDCYSNGCNPEFLYPSATVGWCTQGTYNGCPCEKCGGTTGTYVVRCTDNGCNGYQGICTSGNYDGCPCN